jgi:hypothetical protein
LIYLRTQKGLTFAEIGEALGTTEDSAQKKFQRAERAGEVVTEEKGEVAPAFHVDGNHAEGATQSERIKTLDEHIAACQINTDEWVCISHRVRTYEGWRADTEKEITWRDGRIKEGYSRTGGFVVTTLFSISSTWAKRNPIPIEPTFTPIVSPETYPAPSEPQAYGNRTALFVPDAHIGFRRVNTQSGALVPFHDRKALEIAVAIAMKEQPDYIIVQGDWVDLAMWAERFAKEPGFYFTTQPALIEAHWWLARLRRAAPDAVIVYLEGNHEVRLPNYVQRHMVEAYGLTPVGVNWPSMSVPALLGLDRLGIQWIGGYPQAAVSPVPWMKWTHGDVARVPGASAVEMVKNELKWVVFAHTHRRELASKTVGGLAISGINFGCTCRLDGVVPGSDGGDQWQQGLGWISFNEHEMNPDVEFVAITNGAASWRGERIEGADSAPELREAYPHWNW